MKNSNHVFLEREFSFSRVLCHNGKEINGFVFYNDNGVVITTHQRWLDKETMRVAHNGREYRHIEDTTSIELSNLRNARVEKFDKKDNFILKGVVHLYCGENSDFTYQGFETYEKDFGNTIHTNRKDTFINNLTQETIIIDKCINTRDTEKGQQIKAIQEKLKSVGVIAHLTSSDIEQLLENDLLNLSNF